MEKEFFRKLIAEYQGNDLAGHLAEALLAQDKLHLWFQSLRRRERELAEAHRNALQMLRKELEQIQKECSHWSTVHHTDPSGNNDSYTRCTICGKEVG